MRLWLLLVLVEGKRLSRHLKKCLKKGSNDRKIDCLCGSPEHYAKTCFSTGQFSTAPGGVPEFSLPLKDSSVHMCTICNQINLWHQYAKCENERKRRLTQKCDHFSKIFEELHQNSTTVISDSLDCMNAIKSCDDELGTLPQRRRRSFSTLPKGLSLLPPLSFGPIKSGIPRAMVNPVSLSFSVGPQPNKATRLEEKKRRLHEFSWSRLRGLGSSQIQKAMRKGNLSKAILKSAKRSGISGNSEPERTCVNDEVLNTCLNPGYLFRKHKIEMPESMTNWADLFEKMEIEQFMEQKKFVAKTQNDLLARLFQQAVLKMALKEKCNEGEDCTSRFNLQP